MRELSDVEIAIRILQKRNTETVVTPEYLLDLLKEINTAKQWYTKPKVT